MKVIWEIISAIAGAIAAICAIIAVAVTMMQYRYGISGIDAAYAWNSTFESGKTTNIITTTQHWTRGSVYYGVNQTTGTVKTKYSIYYKAGSGNWVLEYDNGYTSINNMYYGEWYMHSSNGTTKYSYKLVKKTNTTVKSSLIVDLMVQ